MSDPQSKFQLLQFAQAWMDLAEQVARLSDAGRAVGDRSLPKLSMMAEGVLGP